MVFSSPYWTERAFLPHGASAIYFALDNGVPAGTPRTALDAWVCVWVWRWVLLLLPWEHVSPSLSSKKQGDRVENDSSFPDSATSRWPPKAWARQAIVGPASQSGWLSLWWLTQDFNVRSIVFNPYSLLQTRFLGPPRTPVWIQVEAGHILGRKHRKNSRLSFAVLASEDSPGLERGSRDSESNGHFPCSLLYHLPPSEQSK